MLAVFKGRDGSLGLRKMNEYHITTTCKDSHIVLHAKEGGIICYYSSVESFLSNWTVLEV